MPEEMTTIAQKLKSALYNRIFNDRYVDESEASIMGVVADALSILYEPQNIPVRTETNEDGWQIAWYRDGSALAFSTDFGHDGCVVLWMDADSEGYEESRKYFNSIAPAIR